MSFEETKLKVILFFESVEKYYGCKTEITEGLFSQSENFDSNFTTWNLSEFCLIRSAYRNNGDCFMFEGEKMYYEISANKIISIEQPGRHHYEFTELYGDSVLRVTKIRFHSKY